jgi:glycosyltransferase involved in cell wall biosynthesis
VRIGFDATSLRQEGKGIKRFQAELLGAFAAFDPLPELTVFLPEDPDPTLVPDIESWRFLRVRTRPMVLWEQVGLPRAARRERVDVVLTPSERAPLWGPPTVVYLYEHPRHRARRARELGTTRRQRLVDLLTLALFPLSLRRARAVVTASVATGRDVEALRPVEVVPSGPSSGFSADEEARTAVRSRLGLPDGYFLHVASDDTRENSEVLLAALAELVERGRQPALVIAGSVRRRREPLERLAGELGVAAQLRWLGFVPEGELVDLYRGATAYLDPSLYEGFGFQALEALACGTPVIAADATSLPEVVGDAGLLVLPTDSRGFADAMQRLLEDPGLVEELRARSLEQAARFSWERTAREILAACHRAADRR